VDYTTSKKLGEIGAPSHKLLMAKLTFAGSEKNL
jgi:hypothetical protein